MATADEDSLQDLCYIVFGIHKLTISQDGGDFTLGNGDASLVFPQGAVASETSIHYAIIIHGPFVFPTGYKPASVAVYLNMDGVTLLKPVKLILSHWRSMGAGDDEGTLKFLTAPHTLQGGKKCYVFEEQKQVDFITCHNAGVLSIQEPHCVHCIAMKEEDVARYNAISFRKYDALKSTLYFKVQFTCNSAEWNDVRIIA